MAYKPDNRLGWDKRAFEEFFSLTKPGSSWTFIKKNFRDPNRKSEVSQCIDQLYSLFRSKAPYKPLADAFTNLSFAFNRFLDYHQTDVRDMQDFLRFKREKEAEFQQMLDKIQPRLERLWEFARKESLVPPVDAYQVANRHAVGLIAQMRSMLIKKYKDTELVTQMMKVFVKEIKQDLGEGNPSHGDYNEIDVTFDAWEARFVDFTPETRELVMFKRGRG